MLTTVSVQNRPDHNRPLETDHVYEEPIMNVVCFERVCYESGLFWMVCYEQVCFEREPLTTTQMKL